MSMKTIEEIRAAVLAECERVCPSLNEVHFNPMYSLVNRPVDFEGHPVVTKVWEFIHPNFTFLIYAQSPFMGMAYRLLGLQARDAVEAERENYKALELLMIQRNEQINAERARAAKLVALLETMIENASADTLDDAGFREWVIEAAQYRLAAHKEGGAQG